MDPRPLMAAAVVLAVVATGGCGALVNGPQQLVKISTVPPGADVTVDGHELTSPSSVRLDRDRDYSVKLKMEGFEPTQRELRSVRDQQMALGNCAFFLCIPQIWESGSPSHYRLEPEQVEVNLNPIGWSPR